MLAIFGLSINSFATVWTVSNRSDKPAQFSNIQAADNAALPGDTVLIAGSATTYSYGNLIIDRSLTLIGEGCNNPNGYNTTIDWYGPSLTNVNGTFGASNTKFYGIAFNYTVNLYGNFTGQGSGQNTLSNITFERCAFWAGNSIAFSGQIYNNITFRNCVFTGYIYVQNPSSMTNILVTNCVFSNSGNISLNSDNGMNMNGQFFIRNCVFLNRVGNVFSMAGMVVENCIFYAAQPTGASSSTFNNNITYFNNNVGLPYGNNAGSGNLNNVNPNFVNYPLLGANFAWAQNFGLVAGSPAIGTGTNSTNIGLTGGNSPCTQIQGNSKMPIVTSVTVPVSSVPVGGTLQINIKANTRK